MRPTPPLHSNGSRRRRRRLRSTLELTPVWHFTLGTQSAKGCALHRLLSNTEEYITAVLADHTSNVTVFETNTRFSLHINMAFQRPANSTDQLITTGRSPPDHRDEHAGFSIAQTYVYGQRLRHRCQAGQRPLQTRSNDSARSSPTVSRRQRVVGTYVRPWVPLDIEPQPAPRWQALDQAVT